jgi:hypothetical protein
MALFTGRAGDGIAALADFEATQNYNDRQRRRRGDQEAMTQINPETVGLQIPEGPSTPTRLIETTTDGDAATQSAPAPAPEPEPEPASIETDGPVLPIPDGKDNVTTGGSSVVQSDSSADSDATRLAKLIAGNLDWAATLGNIRYGLSVGLQGDGPATNPVAQAFGFFFDDQTTKAERIAQGIITDWYDSDEAKAYFAKFPQELDKAKSNSVAYYESLRAATQQSNLEAATAVADPADLLPLAANAITKINSTRILATDAGGNYTEANSDRDMLLDLADDFGVDEDIALTIWGIETNFGYSGQGVGLTPRGEPVSKWAASGPMQVTGPTFDLMKKYFSNFQNYATQTGGRGILHGDPQLLMEFAKSMRRGDPASEFAAGLMRMKYSEYIGVQPKDWGAAYQAPAERVRDNNGPLGIDDGHTTNADYNTSFNQLRAEIALVLSGEARPAARLAEPEAVAADDVVVPAGVAIPEAEPEAVAADDVVVPAGVAEGLAGSIQNAVTKKNPPEPPAYKKPVDVKLINDELNMARIKRHQLELLADSYYRANMGTEYLETVGLMNVVTGTMTNLAQKKAINLFENGGDPRMLQQMWSAKAGYEITIVPRSDGKWDIMADGQLAYEGYTTGQITSPARSALSSEYTAAINSAAAGQVAEFQKARWSYEEAAMVQQMKNNGDIAVEYYKARNLVKEDKNGGLWIIRGNQVLHTMTGETTGPDGETFEGVSTQAGTLPSTSSIMQDAKSVYQ